MRASAVTGASSIPLRWWPVASSNPFTGVGPSIGPLSGVAGRSLAMVSARRSSPAAGTSSIAARSRSLTVPARTVVSKPASSHRRPDHHLAVSARDDVNPRTADDGPHRADDQRLGRVGLQPEDLAFDRPHRGAGLRWDTCDRCRVGAGGEDDRPGRHDRSVVEFDRAHPARDAPDPADGAGAETPAAPAERQGERGDHSPTVDLPIPAHPEATVHPGAEQRLAVSALARRTADAVEAERPVDSQHLVEAPVIVGIEADLEGPVLAQADVEVAVSGELGGEARPSLD